MEVLKSPRWLTNREHLMRRQTCIRSGTGIVKCTSMSNCKGQVLWSVQAFLTAKGQNCFVIVPGRFANTCRRRVLAVFVRLPIARSAIQLCQWQPTVQKVSCCYLVSQSALKLVAAYTPLSAWMLNMFTLCFAEKVSNYVLDASKSLRSLDSWKVGYI